MLVIGEKINGMYKAVGKAIRQKDKKAIQDLAVAQVKAGADYLDVNVGPAADNPIEAMQWLVETIHEVVEVPLAIDSPKPEVLAAGLEAHKKGRPMINSTTAEEAKLEKLLPLAIQHNARVIGLTMDEKGPPPDIAGRCELALKIVTAAMEQGIDLEDLYLDALILPVNVDQKLPMMVLEAIKEFKMLSDPPPKTVLGLSNVSQRCAQRELINRTYLVMALSYGLDAAIVDPLDKELMDAMITSELLLNKAIYCDSFLEAYRKK